MLYNKIMKNEAALNSIVFSHTYTKEVENASFHSHNHLFYEILFILSGSGLFLVEDTAYEFSRNTVIVIPPQLYHVLKIPPQRHYERYVVHFAPELLPDELQAERPIVRQADEEMIALFARAEAGATLYGETPRRILQGAVITEAMVALRYGKETYDTPKTELPALVQSAVRYICDNLDKPLDIPELARALFVSETYLGHIFARTMNISLMRYVRLKKMYRAREYLKRGFSVTHTAELLGYESYHTFLRNYFAEFATLPSQDRQTSPRTK